MKTISEQLAMFNEPDAGKQVLQYVNNGHLLCEEAQVKIFELNDVLDIVQCLVKKEHSICVEAQIQMLKREDAVALAKV